MLRRPQPVRRRLDPEALPLPDEGHANQVGEQLAHILDTYRSPARWQDAVPRWIQSQQLSGIQQIIAGLKALDLAEQLWLRNLPAQIPAWWSEARIHMPPHATEAQYREYLQREQQRVGRYRAALIRWISEGRPAPLQQWVVPPEVQVAVEECAQQYGGEEFPLYPAGLDQYGHAIRSLCAAAVDYGHGGRAFAYTIGDGVVVPAGLMALVAQGTPPADLRYIWDSPEAYGLWRRFVLRWWDAAERAMTVVRADAPRTAGSRVAARRTAGAHPADWQVVLSNAAERSLRRLDHESRDRAHKQINRLRQTPRPPGLTRVVPPDFDYPFAFMLRAGKLRVLFWVDDSTRTVTVIDIVARKELPGGRNG